MATLGDHWIHQPKVQWLSGREIKVDGKKDWVVSYLWRYRIYRIYRKNVLSIYSQKKNKKNKRILLVSHHSPAGPRFLRIFQPIALPTTKLLGGSFHGCLYFAAIVHIYSWDKPRKGETSPGFTAIPGMILQALQLSLFWKHSIRQVRFHLRR